MPSVSEEQPGASMRTGEGEKVHNIVSERKQVVVWVLIGCGKDFGFHSE